MYWILLTNGFHLQLSGTYFKKCDNKEVIPGKSYLEVPERVSLGLKICDRWEKIKISVK